jgi:predicted Zn finger-like uncharacterized protein
MIIECPNCLKKFQVNSDLIPVNGRNIQCGSCNHIWFFDKKDKVELDIKNEIKIDKNEKTDELETESIEKKTKENKSFKKNITIQKEKALIKYEKTKKSILNILFSYFLVFIISFIALVILLDTLKGALINYFPNLEFILFNLFETLKDVSLFVKDLM